MYWSVRPQYFHMQMTADAEGQWKPANTGDPSQADAFRRIVTKEPKYQSAAPVPRRAQARGRRSSPSRWTRWPPKAKKPDAKGTTAKAEAAVVIEETTAEDADEATDKPEREVVGEKPRAKPVPVKDLCYNRLYFDFNHNGDLTDDKVVERSADAAPFGLFRRHVVRAFRISPHQRHDRRGRDQAGLFFLPGRICQRFFAGGPWKSRVRLLQRVGLRQFGGLPRRRHHPGGQAAPRRPAWTPTATGVSTTSARSPRTSTWPRVNCIRSRAIRS